MDDQSKYFFEKFQIQKRVGTLLGDFLIQVESLILHSMSPMRKMLKSKTITKNMSK